MDDRKLSLSCKPKINLKDIPPLDPLKAVCKTAKNKQAEHVETEESWKRDAAQVPQFEDKHVNVPVNPVARGTQTDFTKTGSTEKGSAKSKLYEICAKEKWVSPVFECWKEEGPHHKKLFTFKVTVHMGTENILESYGLPCLKKKTAAESAAEVALWYLGEVLDH